MLTREQILGQQLRTETVHVKEWGGDVVVRELTAGDRDEYELLMFDTKTKGREKNIRAALVAMSVIDAEGKRLFEDTDIPALARQSGRAVDRVFWVAQRLSAIGPAALAEAVGNSVAPDGAASSSGAPLPSEEPLAS